ncbi:MAG: DegT/DnrJ/EryC1/StrS family aminotransferase [Nanoarchaeota archaeon]|nr:DegT/DnrJ/EryC1/StrS family aminotransferase [Nanoarchaeota archaeon]
MARINWNEPRFDSGALEEISEVIRDSYVNEGPKTCELEEMIRNYLGVKYVVLTTSATAALFLALKADAVIRGLEDFEVIVPDMTMIATANAVSWAGGTPIFVDVEIARGTIDASKIEVAISNKTAAIVPVHTLGRSAEMERIMDVAIRNNLTVIEDAAGALGSKNGEKFLGTIGKVGCFSLQSNKIVTCGQGGIIVTDDDKYYEMIRRLRDFGRLSNKEFLHEIEGYNLKFNDLSAALALSQFKGIERRKAMLVEQWKFYAERLVNVDEVKFPVVDLNKGEVPIWVDVLVEDRDELIDYLKSFDVHCRACWPSVHRNPAYRQDSVVGGRGVGGSDELVEFRFEGADYFADNCVWLPNGPAIDVEQMSFVCEKIEEFYSSPKEVKFEKIHEDSRGAIHLAEGLLKGGKEFTFLEVKKGAARGGCVHDKDEYMVIVSGAIRYICGDSEEVLRVGDSRMIPAGKAHAFIGIEDAIVSEWGITSGEKKMDVKDSEMRAMVDRVNEGR